jgi:methanogenic corrinoid protein MtbC1
LRIGLHSNCLYNSFDLQNHSQQNIAETAISADYRQASNAIQCQIEDLAQIIVARLYNIQPNECSHFGEKHFEKSLRDTNYHLSYLAQALAVNSIPLLTEYAVWCKTLFANLGFSEDVLSTTFRCMREVLSEQLNEHESASACIFLDTALQKIRLPTINQSSFLLEDTLLGELAHAYLEALLRGDRIAARQIILNAAQEGTRIQDIYLHVFQPCQRELGRLWYMNQISVAQEHYATAITQVAMVQLYPYLFSTAPAKKHATVVVAGVSGELHELGARMLADFFEMDGWDSYFLGANTPGQGIIETVQRHQAAVLCISVTAALNVSLVSDVIALLRKSPDVGQTIVMVGGYPFNQVPDLWKQVGADGYAADAQRALMVAHRLFDEKRRLLS